MAAFVYILEHKSGLRYIGSKKGSEDCILKSYFTSSKVVKRLLQEDPNSFVVVSTTPYDTYLEAVVAEDALLRSVVDKGAYLNINFSAGGSLIKSQTHTCITDGERFVYVPKSLPVPAGWAIGWPFKPPSRADLVKCMDTRTGKLAWYAHGEIPLYHVIWKDFAALGPELTEWITNGASNAKIPYSVQPPPGWRFGKTVEPHKPRVTRGDYYTDGSFYEYVLDGDAPRPGFVPGRKGKRIGGH